MFLTVCRCRLFAAGGAPLGFCVAGLIARGQAELEATAFLVVLCPGRCRNCSRGFFGRGLRKALAVARFLYSRRYVLDSSRCLFSSLHAPGGARCTSEHGTDRCGPPGSSVKPRRAVVAKIHAGHVASCLAWRPGRHLRFFIALENWLRRWFCSAIANLSHSVDMVTSIWSGGRLRCYPMCH